MYTHPTTAGNKHIPAGGSSGQILRWSAEGTAAWGADNNTTYSAGTGISLSGTTFSNSGVRSISTGSSNGTISVNTNGTSANVAVKGLGSAAYKDASGSWGINVTGSSASCTGNSATATGLQSSGFGSASPGVLTYYASSTAFEGYSGGWAHYIIANHGNGNTYYHYCLILPFTGPPLYRRKTGGDTVTSNLSDFYYFITSENYKEYQIKLFNTANGQTPTVGTYMLTKGSVLTFEPCDEVTSYSINLGRNVSGKKFNNIYLNASAINGSDIRLKKDLIKLSEDERYIKLFDLVDPYAYKFIDGTSGRTHTGFISQHVEEALNTVGLTAQECAFFCKDAIKDCYSEEEQKTMDSTQFYEEDGTLKYNYSLRYEEYIAITAAKVKQLESNYNNKLTKLEDENTELKSKLQEYEERLKKLEEALGI